MNAAAGLGEGGAPTKEGPGCHPNIPLPCSPSIGGSCKRCCRSACGCLVLCFTLRGLFQHFYAHDLQDVRASRAGLCRDVDGLFPHHHQGRRMRSMWRGGEAMEPGGLSKTLMCSMMDSQSLRSPGANRCDLSWNSPGCRTRTCSPGRRRKPAHTHARHSLFSTLPTFETGRALPRQCILSSHGALSYQHPRSPSHETSPVAGQEFPFFFCGGRAELQTYALELSTSLLLQFSGPRRRTFSPFSFQILSERVRIVIQEQLYEASVALLSREH